MSTSNVAIGHSCVDAAPLVRHAGRVVTAAGLLGIVGQLLFFDVGLGINFPIAIALLLGGGWLLRRRMRPDPRDAWLGPAALLLAAFVAVRGDPRLLVLDVLGSLGLTGLALASFAGRPVLARSFGGMIALALACVGWALGGAAAALTSTRGAMASVRAMAPRFAAAAPVLRGLLIGIPVALLFVALFASADAVFAEVVDDAFGIELDLGDLGWRLGLAAALGWITAGGLALSASHRVDEPSQPAARRWGMGTTELVTVLLVVNAVFILFVALQAAYLFGGLDTLALTGLTYAEYARRGFLELVVAAAMAWALVVAAERLARVRSRELLLSAIGLVCLTAVVLVSAVLRLRLYQEAYGWTELRLYVLAAMVWLAVGLVALAASVAVDRVRWIGHVLFVTALAVGIGLNVVGPVRFVTEQNVARVLDPSRVPENGFHGLDVAYAATLGDDAVPDLVRVLPSLDGDEAHYLATELAFRLAVMRNETGAEAWQAWNLSRTAARDALEAARAGGTVPAR